MLNGRQTQILIQLRSGPWTTGDLQELFGTQQTNVSRDVRKLKKLGYIKASSDPTTEDRRFRPHRITDEGRMYLQRMYGK